MQTLPSAFLFALAGLSLATAVFGQATQLTPQAPAAASTPEVAPAPPAVLVGKVTREQVEEAAPEWPLAEAKAEPEAAAVRALAKVAPGATITIYLGTWCSDSQREVSRFWRVLDDLGGTLPATIELIGVDETKQEPKALIAEDEIAFVPTIIVRRGGKEVGRIVESAPHGIEVDLLDLLEGRAQGVLSLRSDLAPESPKQ